MSKVRVIEGIKFPQPIVTKAFDTYETYLVGELKEAQRLELEVKKELEEWLSQSKQDVSVDVAQKALFDYIT